MSELKKLFFSELTNGELYAVMTVLQNVYHAWYANDVAHRVAELIGETQTEISKRVQINVSVQKN